MALAGGRGGARHLAQLCQPAGEVALDVNADDAPVVAAERCEISSGLRLLQDGEGELFAGNRDVLCVLGRDLYVDAGVRTALVQLPGAVQKSRAEAECRGPSARVPDRD